MPVKPSTDLKERDARKKLVSPKFIERWAKTYATLEVKEGKASALAWANRTLHPDDARKVGEEVNRLRKLNPTLRPKKPD